jgi:hypothetical protein
MQFATSHSLDFEIAPWISKDFIQFKIGTCYGLWRSTEDSYDILAIDNKEPGNGHLNDVFEWFEHSCKRDKKVLRVLEVMNKRFEIHLVDKRGFTGQYNLEKKF